ncbi:MAG: Holliday junction branch migration protein RuvA [Pseudomonadota bacterium]
MIGALTGKLAAKQAPWLLLDVGGVGYEVECPMSTYFALPAVGAEVSLLTHLLVREDAQLLYGFATEAERRLFRSLIRVSGVGARVALAILSGISVEGFVHCVEYEDTATLVKVPGIGKKTAERLIVEMRGRLDGAPSATVAAASQQGTPAAAASAQTEASSALLALGYKAPEIAKLLKRIDTSKLSTEDIIRQALKQAAS